MQEGKRIIHSNKKNITEHTLVKTKFYIYTLADLWYLYAVIQHKNVINYYNL